MKNRIVILTTNKYPNGDAGAVRQHQMAKMFEKKGYEPFVIGYGDTINGIQEFEGVKYISLKKKSTTIFGKIVSRILFAKRSLSIIEELNDVAAIIFTDGLPDLFSRTLKYANRYNIPLVHDSVEWYSPEEFKYGVFSLSYLMKEYSNRVSIKSPIKVIAISKYLENYFSSKGISTIRIPIVMDMQDKVPVLDKENTKEIFVYAGTPGKKDYVHTMLEGFSLLSNDEKKKIEIHIFGIDEKGMISVCGVDESVISSLNGSLFMHGRVKRGEVIEWIKKADTTILLRDGNLRYAKAGFPTKVVESMSYGTPVLCNLTSDLEVYLKNGYNSYVVNSCDAASFCFAVRSFLNKEKSERIIINKNARDTAEKYFDANVYIDALDSFIFQK